VPTEPRTHEPRAVAKRDLIVETALSAFAERGYQFGVYAATSAPI
jgi:hypothetical protein